MRLKRSKFICGMLLGVMLFAASTGCGGSVSGNTFAYEDDSIETPADETIMARVESVDGSKISVSAGSMGGRGRKGGKMPENGEMPEGMTTPEDGEMPEGMTPPEDGEMPEGMTPPEDGEMPEGTEMPERGNRAQGNAAVLTVGDESVIKIMSMGNGGTEDQESKEAPATEAGTLKDITEGSMLMITFDTAGNIIEIGVSEGMKRK